VSIAFFWFWLAARILAISMPNALSAVSTIVCCSDSGGSGGRF